MAKTFYVRCNKARIFISEFHLKRDVLSLDMEAGDSDEQCEGCSNPLIENGHLVAGNPVPKVQCPTCMMIYDIHEGTRK